MRYLVYRRVLRQRLCEDRKEGEVMDLPKDALRPNIRIEDGYGGIQVTDEDGLLK